MKSAIELVIGANRLQSNAEAVVRLVGGSARVVGVVKSDGYGHGEFEAISALRAAGMRRFAVGSIARARDLAARTSPDCEWLVMGWWDQNDLELARDAERIAVMVTTTKQVEVLGSSSGYRCVLEVDLHMNRTGVPLAELEDVAVDLTARGHRVVGIAGHVGDRDVRSNDARLSELGERYAAAMDRLGPMDCSVASSCAVRRGDLLGFPSCRVGQLLYGATFLACDGIAPAMRLTASVKAIRVVPSGTRISYQGAETSRRTRVGVIPAGYGDGVPGELALGWDAYLGEARCRVLAVDMNWTLIDLSGVDASEASEGIVVELIGWDLSRANSLIRAARHLACIPQQLTTRLGAQVPRAHVA